MTVKLLTKRHCQLLSLKGGCTGSSESIHVKIPHCWKSHISYENVRCETYDLLVYYYLHLNHVSENVENFDLNIELSTSYQ